MKKIMFSDKFALTKAVLEGRKTMTRRIAKFDEKPCRSDGCAYCKYRDHDRGCKWILEHCRFKPGEVVAVAQSYDNIIETIFANDEQWRLGYIKDVEDAHERLWWDIPGRNNKMFVYADLMPHRICITDVRIEHMQDITDEDCLREGITREWLVPGRWFYHLPNVPVRSKNDVYLSHGEAFAALIDKLSRRRVWERNPYVFVYSFELVK